MELSIIQTGSYVFFGGDDEIGGIVAVMEIPCPRQAHPAPGRLTTSGKIVGKKRSVICIAPPDEIRTGVSGGNKSCTPAGVREDVRIVDIKMSGAMRECPLVDIGDRM